MATERRPATFSNYRRSLARSPLLNSMQNRRRQESSGIPTISANMIRHVRVQILRDRLRRARLPATSHSRGYTHNRRHTVQRRSTRGVDARRSRSRMRYEARVHVKLSVGSAFSYNVTRREVAGGQFVWHVDRSRLFHPEFGSPLEARLDAGEVQRRYRVEIFELGERIARLRLLSASASRELINEVMSRPRTRY